jgi:hypothetical protein
MTMRTPWPLFIVPRRGVSTVCLLDGKKLVEGHPLPGIPVDARIVHDVESGWIVFMVSGQQLLRDTRCILDVAHRDATERELFEPLTLPPGHLVMALAFHRTVLYVGAQGGSFVDPDGRELLTEEILGLFDFRQGTPVWTPLPLPPHVRRHDKSIDEFLFDGNRMLAIDNIVYPKYILEYDVIVPDRPTLVATHSIPSHGVYEITASASLGTYWLALLSYSGPDNGRVPTISLLDRRTLQEYGFFGGRALRQAPWGCQTRWPMWHSVALRGDQLLLAADEAGIGVLDLTSLPWPTDPVRDDDFFSPSAAQEVFCRACLEQLAYHRLPNQTVLRVLPLPHASQVLAVVSSPAGYDTVLVEDLKCS